MGILTALKNITPIILYGISLVLVLRALTGKTEWLLMLVIMILPLRNVIEKLHAFPLGKDFIDILFIVLLIGTLLKVVTEKSKSFAKSPINPIIFIMILYTFISLLLGAVYLGNYLIFDPSDGRVQIWKNFCMMPLLFFIVLNTITDRKWVWRTILVMCVTIVFMDTYLLRQLVWFSTMASREKVHGTFVYLGPNEVAAFYTQYTVVLLGVYFFMRKNIFKLFLMGLIGINIFCIMFLFSRAAYVSLFIGLLMICMFKKKVLLLPLVLIGIYWNVFLPATMIERIEMTTNEYGEFDESTATRFIIWDRAFELFSESPLIGVGFGVFPYESGGWDTHNTYLRILSEQGLVGLTIFLILVGCFFLQGVRLYSRGDDEMSKGLGLGFAVCIIVLIINNFFGNRWDYIEISAYLWAFAALVARLNIISANASRES